MGWLDLIWTSSSQVNLNRLDISMALQADPTT